MEQPCYNNGKILYSKVTALRQKSRIKMSIFQKQIEFLVFSMEKRNNLSNLNLKIIKETFVMPMESVGNFHVYFSNRSIVGHFTKKGAKRSGKLKFVRFSCFSWWKRDGEELLYLVAPAKP